MRSCSRSDDQRSAADLKIFQFDAHSVLNDTATGCTPNQGYPHAEPDTVKTLCRLARLSVNCFLRPRGRNRPLLLRACGDLRRKELEKPFPSQVPRAWPQSNKDVPPVPAAMGQPASSGFNEVSTNPDLLKFAALLARASGLRQMRRQFPCR